MNRTGKARLETTVLLRRTWQRLCHCLSVFLCLLLGSGLWAGYDEGMAAFKANDFQTALKKWRPLADDGNLDAQYMVGRVYYRFYQDYDEAMKWYRKASEQGHAAAQYHLSGMYREGRGVQQKIATAMMWPEIGGARRCLRAEPPRFPL